MSLPRTPSSQKYTLYTDLLLALDYPESALLAAPLARLVALLRRRSNPIRTQWRRLCHGHVAHLRRAILLPTAQRVGCRLTM